MIQIYTIFSDSSFRPERIGSRCRIILPSESAAVKVLHYWTSPYSLGFQYYTVVRARTVILSREGVQRLEFNAGFGSQHTKDDFLQTLFKRNK